MWKEYFGKNSHIIGLDIDNRCKQHEDLSKNIEVLIGDSSNLAFMESLIKQFPKIDIVIDDGAHTWKTQTKAFLALYDKISANGVYLVEDIHCNNWEGYQDYDKSFIDFVKEKIDLLSAYHVDMDRFLQLSIPYEQRKTSISVPLFTQTTQSISFYDSIIVFEKKPTKEPYSSYQG